jgi:hypothetical protein
MAKKAPPNKKAAPKKDNASDVAIIPAADVEVMLPDAADEKLVARAVKDLQGILRATVNRGMEAIGSYLLDKFYAGSPEAYLSTSPTKHASLSLLLQRCESLELPIRRTALSNALRVAAFSHSLPKGAAFNRLPPSHRVELVRIGDPKLVEAVAAQALEDDLSVTKLRELVRRDQPKAATGRPRTPSPLRSLDACLRQLTNAETQRLAIHRTDIRALKEKDRTAVKARLETLKRRVEALEKLLD